MNPFFTHDNLISLVQPLKPGFPYFRPFILHGEPEQIDMFLIGINPATSIFPNDGIGIDMWIETLMNHNLYNDRFSSNGQTRIGIRGFLNFVKKHYPFSIIETNINAFPTPKATDLKKAVLKQAAVEGENRFKKVLLAHEPSIIILFSQQTTEQFIDFLINSKYLSPNTLYNGIQIKECENHFPFLTFSYPSGKEAKVFACRHLKYFGHKGKSFKEFLDGLKPFLMGSKKIKGI